MYIRINCLTSSIRQIESKMRGLEQNRCLRIVIQQSKGKRDTNTIPPLHPLLSVSRSVQKLFPSYIQTALLLRLAGLEPTWRTADSLCASSRWRVGPPCPARYTGPLAHLQPMHPVENMDTLRSMFDQSCDLEVHIPWVSCRQCWQVDSNFNWLQPPCNQY